MGATTWCSTNPHPTKTAPNGKPLCEFNTATQDHHSTASGYTRYSAPYYASGSYWTPGIYKGRPGDTELISSGNRHVATNWRCIGRGVKRSLPAAGDYSAWVEGELNNAPIGLGYLLTCGYVPDAKTYYCPSSDAMRADDQDYDGVTGPGGYRIASWQKAGGFDAETMLYGAWGDDELLFERRVNSSALPSSSALFSHYNYRNIPLETYLPYCKVQNRIDELQLPGVKPYLYLDQGGPYFRTQKLLGSRALAVDTFNKGGKYDALGRYVYGLNGNDISESRQIAGMGIAGHRDGYNVLYGDWHAAWFGDPQGKLIWHLQGRNVTVAASFVYNTVASNYFYTNYSPFGRANVEGNRYAERGSVSMWHDLDMAGGQDR